MTRNILLILLGFMTGMLADAVFFKLPRLQECYETTSEIMDVVDYYSLMLARSLDTCEELVDENVDLIRHHRDLAIRNAEIIEQCRVRGINIKND